MSAELRGDLGRRQRPENGVPERRGDAEALVLDSEMVAEVVPLHHESSLRGMSDIYW